MIQAKTKSLAQAEMLAFARSQLRFSERDLETHCSASDAMRDRFLAAMLASGVFVPCGSIGSQRFLTAWGEGEVERIKALNAGQNPDRKAQRAHLEDLIETARACGIAVDTPTVKPRTDEERKIWTFISGRAYFTTEDVAAAFPTDPVMVTGFVRSLQAGKVVRFWGSEKGRKLYTTNDPKTARNAAKDLRSTTDGAIWSSIRIKRRFRPADLYAALLQSRDDIAQEDITKYCRTLVQAGFVKPPRPCKRVSKDTPLALVKDAGPLPPQTRRVTVIIDPNEEKIVYSPLGETT
ncbi:hypothetical protein [Pseudophaeobacter sp.]|uniref:hypothetical protein n=1 Tax=Pseudophaeobacter sp. TaxID=1971739 RepID=UPI003297E20B